MNDQELRNAGLKVTSPRLKVLRLLEESAQRHFSAEDIYQQLKAANDDIALATIYRVLTQFEDAGLVMRHNFAGDHAVFELNEGEHHDHLICVKCHKVEEFVDPVIEAHQHEIAKKTGFEMTDHNLNIYGICQDCQKKTKD